MTPLTARQSDAIRMFATFLQHYLECVGVSGSELRKKARLKVDWLETTPDRDFSTVVPQVVGAALKLTGDELLLLHAGCQFHFCLAGLGGFASLHAPTAALALETFGRFVRADDLMNAVTSTLETGETVFVVEAHRGWRRPIRDQMVDGFVSCLHSALGTTTEGRLSPLRARLARPMPSPSAAREFSRILRCDVEFGSDRNEIAYETGLLESPSPAHDGLLYEQLRFAADLRAEQPSRTGPIRQLVEQALRSGADTIEEVSETLRMKNRTLQRRLQTEGTTFRSVHSEVRVEMARNLLATTSLSVPAIARRLKYADDKALRKAIKRVLGITPSEIRDDEGKA